MLNMQGSTNAVEKSCGCLLATSVANYKVHTSSPVVTMATDDADYTLFPHRYLSIGNLSSGCLCRWLANKTHGVYSDSWIHSVVYLYCLLTLNWKASFAFLQTNTDSFVVKYLYIFAINVFHLVSRLLES